jgi:hypothetical protein
MGFALDGDAMHALSSKYEHLIETLHSPDMPIIAGSEGMHGFL